MAVRIRMKKLGRAHRPFFRICAMDSRAPRDGRVIEELGSYDPMVPETDARTVLDGERVEYWLSVGAQPSPKVALLIKKYGKDGTHLNQQQAALSRIAARRGEAIQSATASASKNAELAKQRAEKEAAEKQAAAAVEAEAEAAVSVDVADEAEAATQSEE
ncbi:MAG TPA: 30S ribosomal protein S16 [Pirellulaceae bacterium]|nr:30S ribosomal protein S16 [Pirellulaceae bacterium]HMO94040.1 30S ribosomal protein S16 [Pirellulaceae bacterium]HMP70910.1 30S ribosomal protein S16 [Pirellulaceae bacterium]